MEFCLAAEDAAVAAREPAAWVSRLGRLGRLGRVGLGGLGGVGLVGLGGLVGGGECEAGVGEGQEGAVGGFCGVVGNYHQ